MRVIIGVEGSNELYYLYGVIDIPALHGGRAMGDREDVVAACIAGVDRRIQDNERAGVERPQHSREQWACDNSAVNLKTVIDHQIPCYMMPLNSA